MRKQLITFAQVIKLFVKYQAEGGVLIPSPLAHGLAEYQLSALQASISEVNTGCFTIVETKRLGTNPGF